MATFGYCERDGARYPNARPTNCDAAVKDAIANDPAFKGGVRCTYQDNLINIFGTDPKTGNARNPFDNVGIQYGLEAFNKGTINFDDFVDLNRNIGGMDNDGKIMAKRQVGDPIALKAAYKSGRINEGGAGLNDIPILDIRTWHDVQQLTQPPSTVFDIDVHNAVHSKILRDRLVKSNGDADNMATVTVSEQEIDGRIRGEGSLIQMAEIRYLKYLDDWLTAIADDKSDLPKAVKVRRNRPAEMANACYTDAFTRITDVDMCHKIFPYAAHPRMAAGGPDTDDVMKCQTKAVDPKDYTVTLSPDQVATLRDVFPDGVCDYTKPGVGQVPLQGTDLVYEGDAKRSTLALR